MYLIVSQHLKVFNTADFETLKMYFYTSVSNTFQCSKYILKSNTLPKTNICEETEINLKVSKRC